MNIANSQAAGGGWRHATAQITRFILAGRETNEVLGEITRVVADLSGAELVTISFADSDGQDIVEVESSRGGRSVLGQSAPSGDNVLVTPLGADQGHAMTLTVVSPQFATDSEESEQFLWFSDQVRIAIELGATQRKAEQLMILEDRDRIARDLHDVVIQRLFGAGMQLDSVQRSLGDDQENKAKIDNILLELDTTIKDIRSTIFALRSGRQGEAQTLNDRLKLLVVELSETLDLQVDYVFQGLEQQEVSEQLTEDVMAVVREATTNVARHTQAGRAQITIRVDEEEIILSVINEGALEAPVASVNLDELEAGGHSGLANMKRRAERYSGTSSLAEIGAAPVRTRLAWNASMLIARSTTV